MATESVHPVRRGKRPAEGEPVIDRALGLLGAFDQSHRRLTLSALSRRSGLPLSTARRQAERLVAWGALERAGGEFVVGLRLWEVASLAPRGLGLREVAMPYIEDLHEATRQHVLLAVLEGDEALLVERRSSRDAVLVEYQVGGRLPLHHTGVGLMLLAHASADLQERVLDGRAYPATAEPIKPAALRRTLAEIRRSGVVVVNRRRPSHVVSVAAPIRAESDRVVAALSVVVPAGWTNPRALEPAVRTAARAVSRGLGAPGAASPSSALRGAAD